MNRLIRGVALAAALVAGGLLTAPAARADKVQRSAPEAGHMRVDDAAGLFSPEAVAREKEQFEGTTFQSPTHFLVVTASSIPTDRQAAFDAVDKKDKSALAAFFKTWAREAAKGKDRKGDVAVLVFRNAKGTYFVQTVGDEQSDVYRHFNDKKADLLTKEFSKSLKRILDEKLTGEPAKKEMDGALTAATRRLIDDLKDTTAPTSGTRAAGGSHSGTAPAAAGGSGIMSYVCIGLVVLLGLWLVFGLIRAVTGMGRGGYGGGGPGFGGGGPGFGGGGFGGGGGGGFMTSLLGGMFGAAAGMYLYDQFSGGHHSTPNYTPDATAADGGTTDTGDGNYDGGASAGEGGGDWGDSGGDAGGGGDWGDSGGGDTGGGGDWGGGGGDYGGGGDGGGDW